MSARDDAISEHSGHGHRALTLGLAALAGAAIGAAVALLAAPLDQPLFECRVGWSGGPPVAAEWPREPQAGESARLVREGGATRLVVEAPRAPLARALTAGLLARRDAGLASLLNARARLAMDWRVHETSGADSASKRVQCAALLFARARQQRDLAAATPAAWTGVRHDAASPPVAVRALRESVTVALAAGEPAALLAAIVTDAKAEDAWIASGVPDSRAPFAQRGSLWRDWQLASADEFATVAAASLPASRPAVLDSAWAARDLALARVAVRTSAPFEPLFAGIVAVDEPAATPIARAWGRRLGLGALLGALGAFLVAFVAAALRGRRRSAQRLFVPARDPGARGPWLHVVSGTTPAAIARAAIELSAHALARGERVLVVDGGPHLKLHERFGREARWGLMECLVADMPIVGLVQYGGRPGFYLLAHGSAGRRDGWAALGQRLDDARPHFGRVILALELAASRAIGDALAGRDMEGWWAAPVERLPRAAQELSDRIGIAFSGIDLSGVPELGLEALGGRARALAAVAVLAPVAASEPVPLPELAPLPGPPPEPVVLDCDLQVWQRLRFLAWMRRVQLEHRRAEPQSGVPEVVSAQQ